MQGMDKIMETVVKDSHSFINTELGQHLSVIQIVSYVYKLTRCKKFLWLDFIFH